MQEPSQLKATPGARTPDWPQQEPTQDPYPQIPASPGVEPAPGRATDLDRPMTIPEFAQWIGVEEGWVRKRLRLLPGVIIESREVVRIHPRTYLDGRLHRLSITPGNRMLAGLR